MLNINAKTTGFGSPAETYVDKRLDLNDLIKADVTTFYFKYNGETKFDVNNGDILVVDKAVKPRLNDLVLIKLDKIILTKYKTGDENIWGTITWVLSQKRK